MLSLDFTMPGALAASLLVSLGFPFVLLFVVRLPRLAGRNALQFLFSTIVAIAVWAIALLLVPAARPNGPAEIVLGAMALGAAILVYLEIWALLSRGYTLGLVITIHQAGRGLSAEELAQGYRRGHGLEWIMRHRLAGLEAAGLVCREADRLVLTPQRGRAVAWGCWAAIWLLGLKATG